MLRKATNTQKRNQGRAPVNQKQAQPRRQGRASSQQSNPRRIPRPIDFAEAACAKHYASTVLNPFDSPAGACVPLLPCFDSSKRKIFARGTGATQLNGFGGVSSNTSIVHDLSQVTYTDGSGTGTNMSGVGGGQMLEKNNSELAVMDFDGHRVQGRLVGCGIRLRYTGKEIDMNGTVYALEEPSHLSTGNFTVEDILKFDRVKTAPFNREWVVVSWQPVLPAETAFAVNAYLTPWGGTSEAVNPLVILIQVQSSTTDHLPFEWEVFTHYEAIGSGARGKTPSHVAPIDGPKVIAALSKAPTKLYDAVSNGKISVHKVANSMVDAGSSWSPMWDLGGRVVKTAVGAITSRAASQYMMGGLAAIAL